MKAFVNAFLWSAMQLCFSKVSLAAECQRVLAKRIRQDFKSNNIFGLHTLDDELYHSTKLPSKLTGNENGVIKATIDPNAFDDILEILCDKGNSDRVNSIKTASGKTLNITLAGSHRIHPETHDVHLATELTEVRVRGTIGLKFSVDIVEKPKNLAITPNFEFLDIDTSALELQPNDESAVVEHVQGNMLESAKDHIRMIVFRMTFLRGSLPMMMP